MTKRDAIQFALRVSRKDGPSTSPSLSEEGTFVDPPYRKLLQAAVVALLFFTPLIFPWRIAREAYSFSSFLVPKGAFVQFVVVLAGCYWLVAMVWDGALRFRSSRLFVPLAVFTVLAGISIAYSLTPYSSAVDFAKMFAVILLFPIVLNSFRKQKGVRIGLQAIFFSGLVVAALSLVQLAGGLARLFPDYPGNPQHMYSTFGNDSGVAGYLLPVLPVGIGLFLTSGWGWVKRIYFAGLLAIVYTIMACQTRGVWLGAFVALVFLLVSMVRRRKLWGILSSHRAYLIVAL
ncbi:MAG: hypothetical protein KAJ01_05435, partial [Candidatus Hydrogenedentes bacterium]|nr:hypothetical protein [Candidatus Hydrogenedentota bacterium]